MSQITLPITRPTGFLLNHNDFAGEDCEGDNPHAAGTVQSIHKANPYNANLFQNNLLSLVLTMLPCSYTDVLCS